MKITNKIKYENGVKLILCRKCKKYLPEDKFYRLSGRPHADACKLCRRLLSKEYYDKYRRKKTPEPTLVVKTKEKKVSDVNDEMVKKLIRRNAGLLR